LFVFDHEVNDKQDFFNLNEIKSTEEAGSSKDESGISVIAEDNSPSLVDFPLETRFEDIDDETRSHSDIYEKLLFEVRYEISKGGINKIVTEALDNQIEGNSKPDYPIKHKRKKTLAENEYLEEALKANYEWDRSYVLKIEEKLGLSYRQIYKWYWDRIKRDKKNCHREDQRMHLKSLKMLNQPSL
jgi:hypothetical protein